MAQMPPCGFCTLPKIPRHTAIMSIIFIISGQVRDDLLLLKYNSILRRIQLSPPTTSQLTLGFASVLQIPEARVTWTGRGVEVTPRASHQILSGICFPCGCLPFSPDGQQDRFKGCTGSFVIFVCPSLPLTL